MEFEEYVAARGRALERYAFVLTGDAQRSQDLVQNALVKAYRHWAASCAVPGAGARRSAASRSRRWPSPSRPW